MKISKPYKIYAEVLEEEALKQFEEAMKQECNIQGALMPDAHTGYVLPIGAVIKSKDKIFPSYVGYDIGCGMCAVKLNVDWKLIDYNRLKEHILNTIPLGFEKHKTPINIHLDKSNVSQVLLDVYSNIGVYQIGTLGSGNHFIEVGRSEKDNCVWIVIHSGSRGLGHKIASYYMNEAFLLSKDANFDELKHVKEFKNRNIKFKEHNFKGFEKALKKYIQTQKDKWLKNQNIEGHYSFDIYSDIGKQYINDMNYCLEYALENRKKMINHIIDGISKQLGRKVEMNVFINRNHNHAEIIDDIENNCKHAIHRKGATHANKGMLGVIPGNMIDGSFIVEGLSNEQSLCSSSHGAGRVLSRAKAKKILDLDEFNDLKTKIVNNHTKDMIDESPKAYKNIFEVMDLQKDLVTVIDRCIPLLNIKG